jgi:hypothetical protein
MLSGEFEKLLVEVIDETFSSLGESPKQAILFHLENTFNIEKQEISNKIEAFDDALKKIFGPGAGFLETLILNRLYEKAGSIFQGPPPKEAGFIEAIAVVKRRMEWRL